MINQSTQGSKGDTILFSTKLKVVEKSYEILQIEHLQNFDNNFHGIEMTRFMAKIVTMN